MLSRWILGVAGVLTVWQKNWEVKLVRRGGLLGRASPWRPGQGHSQLQRATRSQ